MKDYLKLLRVKHYIKNCLIFIPAFFGSSIFSSSCIINGILGFGAFSALSSAVYIMNDLKDVEKDRNHPQKKNRPIASGRIKKNVAISWLFLCLIIATIFSIIIDKMIATLILVVYLIINVAYSVELKNRPIIDVVILASGFVLRIYYGGYIMGIEISKWLFLVVAVGSLYMGLGKRRNELEQNLDSREVLKYYNVLFLDKNMYVCVALADVFYALWAVEIPNSKMSWTIPLFIIILMKYSLNIEKNMDGDPIEVILHDKYLIGLIVAYVFFVVTILYAF